MGIRGLSTFFNQNPEFFKPYRLHDCYVIFDGNNLVHELYFNHRINFIYGGDYFKYSNSIRKYFLTFLQCNIKPILIFDGGFDQSGKKLKTIIQRMKQRLSEIEYIAKHGCSSGNVLPLLSHEIFQNILDDLNIAYAQCDFEADDQITALANYYKCPVISADSDFYIYDIHKGFIRIDSIELTINYDIDSDGNEYKFLNCNIYYIDEFVSCFPGIDKRILPLFGTLIGNDYVDGKEFENFFSNIHLPKYKGRKLILNPKQKKMIGLLCWLKNKTLNEAVNQVIEYLKKDKRASVKSIIENAVKSYESHYCNLSSILDKKLFDCKLEKSFSSRLLTPCGSPLPVDFMIKFHSGDFCSFFINAIVSHKVFLRSQIENLSFPSSFTCSRYIRQVIYGILLQHHIENKVCDNQKCLACIEEHDRENKSWRKDLIQPVFSLEGIGMLPKLDEISCIEKEKCKLILVTVLGITSDFFLNLPEEWQLLIGCYNFWLRNCTPYTTEAFIYALIINLIYFNLIKCKNHIGNKQSCPHKKPTEEKCSCPSVLCILSKITESELLFARRNLDKYTHKASFNNGNPLILHILHNYSQVQVCVFNILTLNKLLGFGMKNPNLHECFGGTLLYNLAKDISTRSNPLLFTAEILGRKSNLYILFTTLNSVICQDKPPDCILKNHALQKKYKKKPKRNSHPGNKISEHACNKFDILNTVEQL